MIYGGAVLHRLAACIDVLRHHEEQWRASADRRTDLQSDGRDDAGKTGMQRVLHLH